MATNYSRSIAQIVVAQLAEDAGFETAQKSSLDILSDLLLRYIAEIGRSAHAYADCAQRACPNADDVLKGLLDMGVRLDDITAYTSVQEVPFAHVLPPFPVQRQPKWPPSFEHKCEEPPKHIPAWLPALPDKHTYVATPAFDGHDPDQIKQRQSSAKAKRQAEKALVRLSKRTSNDTATGAAGAAAVGDSAAAAGTLIDSNTSGNPFLAATTWEAASAQAAAAGVVAVAMHAQPAAATAHADADKSRDARIGSFPLPDEALPTLEDAFAVGSAPAANQSKGSWQEADAYGAAGAGEAIAGSATFSQQWSPAAVASAGSGPSRLKEPLAIFREQEDAFAAAEKAEAAAAEAERVRMGRKAAAKSRSGRTPSEAPGRAQQILNAGEAAVITCGENEGGRAAPSDDE